MQSPTSSAGILYSASYQKAQDLYQRAVERADFLKDEEKLRLALLGYRLSTKELKEAKRTLISKDLARMKTRSHLKALKKTHNK